MIHRLSTHPHRPRATLTGVLVTAAWIIGALDSALADTVPSRPDVLFRVVDDMNDWNSLLNPATPIQTPNLERLARRGILFTHAYCDSAACNPSRAAVFSGRMPQVTGVWSNRSGSINKRYPKANLLPATFTQAGYRALGTGKLLHSGGKAAFDEYFGTEQRWSPLTKKAVQYTDEELPTKGTDNPRHVTKDSLGRGVILPLNRMPSDRGPDRHDGESFDWGPWDVPDSDFGDTLITDWAIEKIKQAHDKPIFLGVGYYRPHIPLWSPKRFFDRFADSPGKLPQVKDDDLDDLSNIAKRWALEPVTAGSHATVVKHKQWRGKIDLVRVQHVSEPKLERVHRTAERLEKA